MSQASLLYSKKLLKWFGINALIGFCVPLFYAGEKYLSVEGWGSIWDDILYGFMMSCGISIAVGLNERFLDKHFPWLENAGRRLFFEILGVTVLGFSASYIMNVLFYSFFGMLDYTNFPWKTMAIYAQYPLYIGYGVTAFFISQGFLKRLKELAIRAQKLETERYRGEVRMLKDQLNPHFLFNSFNALTNMVYEDADQAAAYIQKLSKFYRYVLEVQNEDLVTLAQEIKFARDYWALQEGRFSADAMELEIDQNTINGAALIPPMTLQLLLENAIKHNQLKEDSPLTIKIYQEHDHILVRNKLQKRLSPAESSGIGLSNIKERYKLLRQKEVEISESTDYFTVKLPLILS
jgi:sensor histidine kinase YesM